VRLNLMARRYLADAVLLAGIAFAPDVAARKALKVSRLNELRADKISGGVK
jgi:hypothetical protein